MRRLLVFALVLSVVPLAQGADGERKRAEHALNRLAFGARPGDVDRVLALGVDRWIEQQLHPEHIDDQAVERRIARYDTEESERPVVELSAQRIVRAAESERQLNEVMVDFWMNHFNVYAGKGLDRKLIAAYERDDIRPHLWGRFEDLLMASAKAPAMLVYLDNARSRRDRINENYARELMELHTLGVDGGYTQKDVTELARALTGWSITKPENGSEFVFRVRQHDRAAKTIVGVKLAAGGGIDEGERILRHLAAHPSTARHIATKLAQRFVSDDPPRALIDRVAKRFTETRGDLRETVKAVITSPEFSDPRYAGAKMKSPFEYAVSAVRAVDATIANPLPLVRRLKQLGQPLYFAQPPTGYADDARTWTNSGALVERINFAVDLTKNKVPGLRVALASETAEKLAIILASPEFQRQ